MGHLSDERPSPLLIPAFFMLFIEKLWFNTTLTFWELVNLTLHKQQYFYQETISRKVTNQGSRSQSDYEGRIPPPYSNPLFQYHGIFIIIIYYCNFVLFCFFIISFLFDLLFWFCTTLFIFIPFFLFFFGYLSFLTYASKVRAACINLPYNNGSKKTCFAVGEGMIFSSFC